MAVQTEDDFVARMNELEGQLALHEDAAANRERELAQLRARVGAMGSDAEGRAASRAARCEAELEALRQTSQELKRRNEFLTGIISRFERKTMGMEKQIAALGKGKKDAEARAEAAERLREAEVRVAEQEAAERLSEQREAAESAGVAVRELKREHNRKMQELLRRMQALEKRNHELGSEKRQAEAQPVPVADPVQGGREEPQELRDKELRELKELNAQLIERLSHERAAHATTRDSLAALSNENETLSVRIEALSEQLVVFADLNDQLAEELHAANAACCAAATAAGVNRLDTMS